MDFFLCPSVERIKNKKVRMAAFLKFLGERYPEPECALTHMSTFELICATILSAQCTDRQVNLVTPALFKAYPDAESLATAKIGDVEKLVKSTGFYKNKAKNLVAMAANLVLRHKGEVPQTMEELTALPGVGRKTANVVLGNAYNIPGMVVDTHVARTALRLGFTKETDPVKVEQVLMKQVPKESWNDFSHQVIYLGREFCTARKPKCENCPFL